MRYHPYLRTYLRVITFVARILGWVFVICGLVTGTLLGLGILRGWLDVIAAVATIAIGTALVISKPLVLEKMPGFDDLGEHKVSTLRQNSKPAAPNKPLQRSGND